MKIAIVDKGAHSSLNIKKELKELDFDIVKKDPKIVISLGGDGTLFIAERIYPGIPKLLIKDSKTGYFYSHAPPKQILRKLKNKSYTTQKCIKLEVGNLKAMNDIIIRSKNQYEALRFKIKIDNEKYSDEFIGDGLIIATHYGSTGYFNSATRKLFSKGKIGIAFNNTYACPVNPIIIPDNKKIEVKITRGTAQVSADNNPKILTIKENSKITIKKSRDKTSIIKIKNN